MEEGTHHRNDTTAGLAGHQQLSEWGPMEHGWLQESLAWTASLAVPPVTAQMLWVPTLCWH